MTNIENKLWDHLVEHHGADRARVRASTSSRTRRRPLVIGTAATGLAGVAAAAALVVSLTGTTPPAYALASHADGSYTLTINDIATAVPQVNAAFVSLGINARAIPVTSTCTAPDAAKFPLVGPTATSPSQSVTIDNADIPAGTTAVVAAEQTPSGVRLSMGTTTSPLPSCLNSNQVAPVMTPGN